MDIKTIHASTHASDTTTTVSFAGQALTLDRKWTHERQYLEYIENGRVTGPVGMDVWAFSHLVTPGDTVLDAGANVGFTALLAKRSGASSIHCFEPDPRFTERLNAFAKPGSGIHVYPVALGQQSGSLDLCISVSHNQGSTLSPKHLTMFPSVYENSDRVRVDVATIDDRFARRRFDFFKIDVEGAEYAALKGAETMLKAAPPRVIYVELYDEYYGEVHDLLSKYFAYSYRLVCDQEGNGRLFPADVDVAESLPDGIHVMPPSFVYALSPQTPLIEHWISPRH